MTTPSPADHLILVLSLTLLRCLLLESFGVASCTETASLINIAKAPFHLDFEELKVKREKKLRQYGLTSSGFEVDRRQSVQKEEFVDLYDGKWPVILTDIVPDWPAYHWTKEFLLGQYGEEAVIIATIQGGLWNASGESGRLADFVNKINDVQADSWVYVEDEVFLYRHPELLQDIDQSKFPFENFFKLLPESVRPWPSMLLWGSAYSRSPLHIDPYNWTATSAVIWGTKHWKLYPPGQDRLMYIQRDRRCGYPLECIKYNSEVDAYDTTSVTQHPLLSEARVLEVEQKPGEMLVIPPGWFHQAYNTEETLAISSQYMNEQNHLFIIEEIIKAGNIERSQLLENFMYLLPKDQVLAVVSLLSPELLSHGKQVTEQILKQIHAEL